MTSVPAVAVAPAGRYRLIEFLDFIVCLTVILSGSDSASSSGSRDHRPVHFQLLTFFTLPYSCKERTQHSFYLSVQEQLVPDDRYSFMSACIFSFDSDVYDCFVARRQLFTAFMPCTFKINYLKVIISFRERYVIGIILFNFIIPADLSVIELSALPFGTNPSGTFP